jgi:hypothetical protein
MQPDVIFFKTPSGFHPFRSGRVMRRLFFTRFLHPIGKSLHDF